MYTPKPKEFREPQPFKPIRKSAFMTYKKCPKKFYFQYFVHSDSYWDYNMKNNNNTAAAKGDIFHAEVDGLYEKIDIELLYELTDEEKIVKYMRDKFSYSDTYYETKTDMDEWFDWFAETEAKRSLFFKQNYTKVEFMDWFPPKATELKMTMPDSIDRTGHVDRVDYLPKEKAYCIVEYKTGKSYDPDKPWSLTALRAETAFYAIIANEMKLFDKPVHYWSLYNPRNKRYFIEKFPAATIRAVNNTYKGLVQKIKEAGDFDRKITPLCMWCDYRRECFHGAEGEPKKYIIPIDKEDRHDTE